MVIHRRVLGTVLLNSFIIVLLILTCVFSPVKGDAPAEEWVLAGQLGGSTQAVSVNGDIAYIGVGMRILSIDISNPSTPRLIGMSDIFSDTVLDLVVQGETAYIAAGNAGLQIVDISEPDRLKTLGSWNSSGYAEGVAVNDKVVYLANGDEGLSVLNVSNPKKPALTASVYPFHYAFDVVTSGSYAYVASGDAGLLVVDIKNPNALSELAQLDTPGYAYDLALAEGYLYAADGWEGVQVIDIRNPTKPLLTAGITTTGWSIGVAVEDDLLVTCNGGQGLQVFNVSNPAQPKEKSTFKKTPDEGDVMVRRAILSDRLLLAADTVNGLRLIDVSLSLMPVQKGLYSQLPYARRVKIDGDFAYVATAAGGALYTVNITDAMNPYQVSKFQADGIAVDVVLNGDYATLGTFEDATNCYNLVDISDPGNLQFSDAVDMQSLMCGAPRQMVGLGDLVYSADEWGLSIYDLSQAGSIKTIGRIELHQEGGETLALAVVGDFAYVSDSRRLRIIDVSNPAEPQQVQVLNVEEGIGSVFSMDERLYLGHYGEGLSIYTNPTPGSMPSLISRYKTRGSVEEVSLTDEILTTSEGSGGLEIIDASDPYDLKLLQTITTPGFAWASVLLEDVLYVAGGAAGLLIYQKLPTAKPASQTPQNGPSMEYPVLSVSGITKGAEANAPNYLPVVEKVVGKSVCTVTSVVDSGAGTLRDCLTRVKAGESILFDPAVFPPENPATISLQSTLPALDTGSVTVDASNAGVKLDGQKKVAVGLVTRSAYNTIMGIELVNFTMDGITLEFPSEYNQIGGDHTIGSSPSGQGNAISGCFNGVRVLFSRYNTIKGNFIGTNAKGTQAAEMNEIGIGLYNYAEHNMIGGPAEGEKNIVSNNNRGVDILGNSAAFNVVAGNYIGTDVTGNRAIPNISWGVLIETGGRNNIIGGTTPQERNILSGNYSGVTVSDYASTQNSIIGNYIGLDVSGKIAVPNLTGTNIFQSVYNRIGGTKPGEKNIISGNSGHGVRFTGIGGVHAILLGNVVGWDPGGEIPLGNSIGLIIDAGSHSLVGGLSDKAGNIFANNGLAINIENGGTNQNWLAGNKITGSEQLGVIVTKHAENNTLVKNFFTKNANNIMVQTGVGNTLRANAIAGEWTSAIELTDGGNLMLEPPVINQAKEDRVTGTSCPSCRVEIFSNTDVQNLTYEGFTTADINGNFSYTGELTGPSVTATATDPLGNTSPFSRETALVK